MLTDPSNLLLLHIPRNIFQEGLLHDLPRDQSETDLPAYIQLLKLFLKMSTTKLLTGKRGKKRCHQKLCNSGSDN